MKHKHADLIIAWANGAIIEKLYYSTGWHIESMPSWDNETEYRIKPEPKPDVVLYAHAYKIVDGDNDAAVTNAKSIVDLKYIYDVNPNIKLTYDGNTNELKAVELM